MAKLKKVVKVEGMEVVDVVKSCVKLFGSARAEEVLPGIYEGKELEEALDILQDMDLLEDVSNELEVSAEEELEMEKIEVNEQGEQVMAKKQIKEKELDFNGIDAMEDTRTVEHDSGASNEEDTFEYWASHASNEDLEPVSFREVVNKLDDGVYKGTVRNVSRFYSAKMGQFRVVVNVNLPPFQAKAEHRWYLLEACPSFMSLPQYRSLCEQMGWDYNDMKGVAGSDCNIVIETDKDAKRKKYFLQVAK